MHTYYVTGTAGVDEPVRYHATLASAHKASKDHVKIRPQDLVDIRIELMDVHTDKAAVLRILNNEGIYQESPLRTWRLGDRGGLIECPNGE